MDNLWHTVELKDVSCYVTDRPFFDRVKSLYGPHLVIGGKETAATTSPFLRNLHRVRVIEVQYTSFLNLLWEQSPSPLEDIPLEKLSVDFEDDPKPRTYRSTRSNQSLERTEIEAILQILARSTRLSTFSFMAGVLTRKLQLEDQARVLASLPASLQRLDMTADLFSRPPVAVDQELRTTALHHFLELKKGGHFENLTTLSMMGLVADLTLLEALVERSPKLEELKVHGHRGNWDDSELVKTISKVCSKGWKTLGFDTLLSHEVGPLTVAAILQNCANLENLRLPNCKAFDSKSIQKLLCSAPNLKRLDLISDFVNGELEPYSLMAMDIVESTEEWVCLGLEAFKCYIGGVPRPDITYKTNGRPLTGIYNNGARYSMTESTRIQRRVLAQLGRLTKLREITLGKDVANYDNLDLDAIWFEKEMEGDYASDEHQLGSQYQSLTMSLQDGLDELKDLKCLRRLTLEKMSLGVGKAEQMWMKENWPEYGEESKDTFWTSRGHSLGVGSDLHDETFRDEGPAYDALDTYDWW